MNNHITQKQLDILEQYLERLFDQINIDIDFTRHFIDRVNDPRNREQISIEELFDIFKKEYKKYGMRITKMGDGAEAVFKDMSSDINVPFILRWDPRNLELDLIAKTIMRKKKFKTPDRVLRVESYSFLKGL